ncbi:TIR protein [Candidatus Magnetomorum sp. HK-1]|nr:TIR protein [Candidatus Magnetomorum sp. HK-1]
MKNKNDIQKEPQRIFVSYAHADNQQYGADKIKWVSKLVENIRKELKENVKEAILITDHMFDKQGRLVQKLKNEVEKSSLFIPIISKAYLDSEYCRKERQFFFDKYKTEYNSRIIAVEKNEILSNNPFGPHLRHPFWFIDSESQRTRALWSKTNYKFEINKYFLRMDDLGFSICNKLKELEEDKENKKQKNDLLKIFLAEPTDASFDQYMEIKKHLSKKGFFVLPEFSYKSSFHNDPDSARTQIEADIKKSKFFIQIIESNFSKSPDERKKVDEYCILQNELARNAIFERKFLWTPKESVKEEQFNQIELIDWLRFDDLKYDYMADYKIHLMEKLSSYLVEHQKGLQSSLSNQNYDGLMLVSGNIPVSKIRNRVRLLLKSNKPIYNFYEEYFDSNCSRLLFFNQAQLPDPKKYQLFVWSNNNLRPLHVNI